MSQELRALLSDLALYLEQQQLAGGTFYLESPPDAAGTFADVAAAEPAAAPVSESPDPAPAAPPAAPRPGPATASPPPPSPAPAPSADKPLSPREQAFQQQCAVFVREALATIGRTRQHAAPATKAPAESDLFKPAAEHAETAPAPADTLDIIADEVRTCTACGLHASRQQPVPGAGHPHASLMLIGEAPGQAEDRQGLPFVGPSGKLLTDILKAIGFAREDVFIGNVLKCRPPGNRDPQPDEVVACKAFLRRQIKVIQPRIILCLGRIAAHTLLDTTASLRDLRSSVHFFAGVPVMATYHPAALLRNPAQKRDTWDDVRKLRALHDALGGAHSG